MIKSNFLTPNNIEVYEFKLQTPIELPCMSLYLEHKPL